MKSLKIVGLIVSLLVFSMALVQGASASPINPPSPGCQAANVHSLVFSYHLGPITFYDDDTLHFSTNGPVNIHVTSNQGINQLFSNVTSLNLNIAATADYTLTVTRPVSTAIVAFHLNLSCSSTPISAGCIVTNDSFTGSVSFSSSYNAGEQFHVLANGDVNISITGAASAFFGFVTNQYYSFPVTGSYTVEIRQSFRGTTTGAISCTQPRNPQ